MSKQLWIIFAILLFLLPIIVHATDTSSLLNGLTHVWQLGSETDAVGGYNLTSTNVQNVTGVYGTAYNYTGLTSFSIANKSLGDNRFSVNCWSKLQPSAVLYSVNSVFSTHQFSPVVTGFSFGYTNAASNNKFYTRMSGVTQFSTQQYQNNTLYMFSNLYNGSQNLLYLNKNIIINVSSAYQNSSNLQIGRYYPNISAYVAMGMIDECYYWNRTLTQNEINILYNSAYGCFYPFNNCTFFFFGNITSPLNNTRSNERLNATFYVSRLNETNFNCSIYINGQLNQTNESVQANTLTNFFIEDMADEGAYNWVLGCQNENFSQNASTFYYYYDPNEPFITLQQPSYLNTSTFDQNIYINGNITDNSLYKVNLTIYAPNSSIIYNNYSGVLPANTTFYDLTKTIASWQLPNGTYTFYLEAADSHTAKFFKEDVVIDEKQKDKDYDLKLSKDTVNFKLSDNLGIKFIKDFDRIKFELDGKAKKEKKQIKFQPTEQMIKIEGSPYACHYVFGDYWFDCEGLENPVESFDKNTNTLTIDFDMSTDKVITDSLGGLNENNLSLTFEINHSCIPNWTAQYGSCEINDSYQLTYTDANVCGIPLNLPADNDTWLSCNYCSADIINATTSACYHNGSFDYENITYSDNNYATCCAVTGIASDCIVDFEPYNITFLQRCYIATDQFIVQFDEHADFGLANDKVFWAINLNDSSNAYKCTSYVITEEGRLIQTNPTYTKQSDTLIKFRDTNYEDREFFNIENGIGNIYFTKENLIFDGRDYLFGAQCAGNNQTLKSERWVTVGYENLNAPVTRSVWATSQMYVIIFSIIGIIIIMFLIAFIWNIWKGNTRFR